MVDVDPAWGLGKLANRHCQLIVLEEGLILDKFDPAGLFKLREGVGVPVVAEVAESGGEYQVASWFKANEHLFENSEIQEIIVNKSGGSNKVVLLSLIEGHSVNMFFLIQL